MTQVVFIGEAWGQHEAEWKHPFVGPSGVEFYRMLHDAGFPTEPLPYSQFVSPYRMTKLWADFPHALLNVFDERPADNKVDLFFATLKDNVAIDRSIKPRRIGSANAYVRAEYAHHVKALHERLKEMSPNLIVPLGATACWAIGLGSAIGKLRGSTHMTPYGKALPVFHPAAILRNWSNRVTTILDLFKARKESAFAGIQTTERVIWTEPTIEDLYSWWEHPGSKSTLLSVDIETIRNQQISEIGFASDPYNALHIPFLIEYPRNTFTRYYKTLEEEVKAWEFVRMVLDSPIPKIGQNFKYDTYWLVKEMGFNIRNWTHDTMQLAHCWQPELQKGLGFLGSIFMNEQSWKHIRADAKGE